MKHPSCYYFVLVALLPIAAINNCTTKQQTSSVETQLVVPDRTTTTPNLHQQQSLSMAYLAYSGELLTGDKDTVENTILKYINKSMKEISVLSVDSVSDWKVVWGPAIYTLEFGKLQDNMMFVVRQLSSKKPNYIVGIRGTNAAAFLDWVEEDFDVLEKVDWYTAGNPASGTPKISKATDIGFKALLTKMTSPLDGSDITTFLTQIAETTEININFTGHSLAGALAPTLALWFKQSQVKGSGWDPDSNATITTTPFAGATAGNTAFAAYSHKVLGSACDRIHNLNDVVPHGWETKTLRELNDLYSSINIKPSRKVRWIIDIAIDIIKDYKQIKVSNPFTFPLNPKYDTFPKQAEYQHVNSYPVHFGVPELNKKGVIIRE